jgi:hypothetical protein
MKIPFATEAYKRSNAFLPEQKCVNFLVEEDDSDANTTQVMLLQRPGLDAYATLPAPIQGLYSSQSALASTLPTTVAVAGNILYSLDDTILAPLGTMSGTDGLVKIVSNFDRICIVSGPLLYCYGASTGSTANTFRYIPTADSYQVADVTSLDGYFIVAMTDSTFFWLNPGDDDWNGGDPDRALQFATAESQPDGLVGVNTLDGNLFFFGQKSIEVWQPTGNGDAPFQRVAGQLYQRGCLARDTIVQCDNSLFWVGDDCKVYRVSSVPLRVSTSSIEERIRKRTGDLSAWTFDWDGHLVYVLRIAGQGTFGYDVSSKRWSELASEGYGFFRPVCAALIDNDAIVGDSETGALWKLSDSSTDAGTLIRRTASGTIALNSKPIRNDNIVLDVGSEGACHWMLRWADGDQNLDDQPWVSLPARTGADTLTLYRLGIATQPYRTFEIEVTDPVAVRFSGARAGEAWK